MKLERTPSLVLDRLLLLLTPAQMRAFLACYAGTDVRFEKSGNGPSFVQLARLLGDDAAQRVRQHFAGERVYIPRDVAEERATRDAEIRARLAAGESAVSIARSYRVVTTISERHVRRIAAAMTKDTEATTDETA